MGGGATKYAMTPSSSGNIRQCDWILTPDDRVTGSFSMNTFNMKSVVGKGKFGLVYTAQHTTLKKYIAIKFISKAIIFETKSIERIQQEISLVRDIHHPFIVHSFGVFEMEKAFGLVLEYAAGGELYTRIRKENKFKEEVAKFYFCEIASAIGYLHSQHIVFRDLKPENILIDNDGHIKLCDFGFAVQLSNSKDTLNDGCGTAMYAPPEIASGMMKNSHGLPVDWWSLGCILFEMVTGEPPFGDTEKMSKFEIFNNINSKSVSFPMSSSPPLKEMIKGLLCKDASSRFAMKQVKVASWVCDIDWHKLSAKKFTPPWTPKDRLKYNTSSYLDWPKESLENLKVPSSAESSYCSAICVPNAAKSLTKKASTRGESIGTKSLDNVQYLDSPSTIAKAGAGRKSINKAGSEDRKDLKSQTRQSFKGHKAGQESVEKIGNLKDQSRKSFKRTNSTSVSGDGHGDLKAQHRKSMKGNKLTS